MAQRETEPTVLIVGAGIFGTSTAYHLAKVYKDASKITVIDRTASPPEPAASTDINKIIRADYSSPFYCDLAYEALHAWATWPELKPFYHQTGWINLVEEGSDLAERIRKVFKARGHDPTKDVALEDLDKHWKGIMKGTRTEGFRDAYWNPEAGWCDAAAATASMMKAAQKYGVQYETGDVAELCLEGSIVKTVRLKGGKEYAADKLVFATGAWTSSILSPIEDELEIPEDDRIERQAQAAGVAVAHYKMSPEEMDQLSEMPVVVYGEEGEVIPPPANHLLKYTNSNTFTNTITTETGHKISVPLNQDQHIVSERLKRETEAAMSSKVMPAFTHGKEADYWRLCWDSFTPTQDWLLCQHPHERLSNLYLAIGGSFHSYKFLPIAGKYMANVLSGRSDGSEKDEAWQWKKDTGGRRGAHEKTKPKRELRDLLDDASNNTSRL
jgi:sarcosine oxidase / L-pipecolate oxidase